MKKLDIAALILVIVGGLNWGLVAVAEVDLVAGVAGLSFGETNALTAVIYGLVGLSAIWLAVRVRALVGAGPSRAAVRA